MPYKVISITQDKLKLKPSFGTVNCQTTATADIRFSPKEERLTYYPSELYTVVFTRNQITGRVSIDEVMLPETTTERTASIETVKELLEDELGA